MLRLVDVVMVMVCRLTLISSAVFAMGLKPFLSRCQAYPKLLEIYPELIVKGASNCGATGRMITAPQSETDQSNDDEELALCSISQSKFLFLVVSLLFFSSCIIAVELMNVMVTRSKSRLFGC